MSPGTKNPAKKTAGTQRDVKKSFAGTFKGTLQHEQLCFSCRVAGVKEDTRERASALTHKHERTPIFLLPCKLFHMYIQAHLRELARRQLSVCDFSCAPLVPNLTTLAQVSVIPGPIVAVVHMLSKQQVFGIQLQGGQHHLGEQ